MEQTSPQHTLLQNICIIQSVGTAVIFALKTSDKPLNLKPRK